MTTSLSVIIRDFCFKTKNHPSNPVLPRNLKNKYALKLLLYVLSPNIIFINKYIIFSHDLNGITLKFDKVTEKYASLFWDAMLL